MSDLRDRIDELAGLMAEFQLAEGELSGENWRVALRRRTRAILPEAATSPGPFTSEEHPGHAPLLEPAPTAPAETKPAGIPVNSPMTGIYYTASSPSSPPFVKVGDVVEAGQVVGLIEAMKVFNELVAPMSGTVTEIVAENGQLVQPGEALLYLA